MTLPSNDAYCQSFSMVESPSFIRVFFFFFFFFLVVRNRYGYNEQWVHLRRPCKGWEGYFPGRRERRLKTTRAGEMLLSHAASWQCGALRNLAIATPRCRSAGCNFRTTH